MKHDFQPDIDAIGDIAAVPLILDVVTKTTGLRFASVARVTPDRWVTCMSQNSIGFDLAPGQELPIETTICTEVRASHEAVIIDCVAEDAHFSTHPVPLQYGFQSYISVPIYKADGSFFGTLCALDPEPHKLNTPEVIGMFNLFAELIGTQLDARERMGLIEKDLAREKEIGELREQFIAILGHDLRNPVASISAGTRMLLRRPLDADSHTLLKLMQDSTLRIGGIIDNLLDFARSRLGGGMPVARDRTAPLGAVVDQIVAEFRSDPEVEIAVDADLRHPVDIDATKIGQLLSNLIGNALTHGAKTHPVRVLARTTEEELLVSVRNAGMPISPERKENLFQPFHKVIDDKRSGLGLGLYIAAQIAEAHGGTLNVESSQDVTEFTFRMPR